MPPLRVLFYSSSIGLGHVTRDVAIADAIREASPGARIDWMASSPAREYLAGAGESLHPQAAHLSDATAAAEAWMRSGTFNITRWAVAVRRQWGADGRLVLAAAASGGYDAVIGDEAYDIAMALTGGAPALRCPCFVLYDFLGLDSMTAHPVEWIGAEAINRAWARDPAGRYQAVFLGEIEDLPLRRFGLFGPRRRHWAARHAEVVGHVLPFDPEALSDRARLRAELGYDTGPLMMVSGGGTAAGSRLMERCLDAFPLAQREIPDLRMVLVGGPRLSPASDGLPPGVEARGYVPRLYQHFAACDLAIVQGGGATTLELTALQRPFLFFPLRGHCEQMGHVAARQERLGAGVKLDLRRTSTRELVRQIVSNIGREVRYPALKLDGARGVARLVTAAAG